MQLCKEGTIQVFTDSNRAASDPIVAAVGTLQFDVLLFRLNHEYNVDCSLEKLPIAHTKWTDASLEDIHSAKEHSDFDLVKDINDSHVILFKNDFTLNYFIEKYPSINLYSNNAKVSKNIMNV
jgi:peptide chain release factor 3